MATEDEEEAAVAFEIGLGRERLLSYDGRLETVERWYAGDPGPRAEVARTAPAACATCGFFLPLAGGMRQAFGACANEFAPDDGKVVAVDHGCGAHSEAVVVPVSPAPPPPLIDEAGYDIVERPTEEERARLVEQAKEEAAAAEEAAAVAAALDGATETAQGEEPDEPAGDESAAVEAPEAEAPAAEAAEAEAAERNEG
jgi:hypothetical protein